MDGVLERLYRRYRARYYHLVLVLASVAAVALAVAMPVGLSLYEEEGFSSGQMLRTGAVLVAIVLGGCAWASYRVLRAVAPALRWQRDPGTGSPLAGWLATMRLPVVGVMSWAQYVAAVSLPAWGLIAFAILDLALVDAVALGAVAVGYVLAGLLSVFFFADVFIRPAARAIAAAIGDRGVPLEPRASLRWEFLGVLLASTFVTAGAVGILSTAGGSLADLRGGAVAAFAAAVPFGTGLAMLLSRRVLDPIQRLAAGTERVAQGDLSTRVPLTSDNELGALASRFNAMVRGLEERGRLAVALGAYTHPDVAERLLAEGERLRGEEVEVTVMVVDIRGFTALAESVAAQEAVDHLNRFFDLAVPVVEAHGGHVNKFTGDGFLAVFGAPRPVPDHAAKAVAAACEIDAALRRWSGDGPVAGIGISSGTVLAGTVGGGHKLDYTVIGDTVNVAARVEELTKETGHAVLVSESTAALLDGSMPLAAAAGPVTVRGRAEPVRLYSPAEGREDD